MLSEVARSVFYTVALCTVLGTVWAVAWSNGVQAEAKRGWWPPLKAPIVSHVNASAVR